MYKLSKSFQGHSNDVRALISTSEGVIYSGSRDKSVLRWSLEGNPSKVTTLSKYVSSLALTGDGFIVVGCNDGIIRIYKDGQEAPITILEGHQQSISCIFPSKFGTILSGSWDSTVRIWAGDKCTNVLEGHSAAVWAVSVFPESGIVVSGSADKTLKLWKTGVCLKTLQGHTDCIRAVIALNNSEFLSGSNDATIRKWNLNGECLKVFHGHEHYIYSLFSGYSSDFEFVSSGEDRTVRLWKDGSVKQTLRIPAQSIWCINVLHNGDVAAGSSDGNIWIFSSDPSRQASLEVQKEFEEVIAQQKLANQTHLGNMKMSDIPGKESLLQPGTKDGVTKMVRDGKCVSVYSWSQVAAQWTKIGDVVGAPESNKQIYEGKEYDYVFDIDLDDPPRIIKLPFNADQDPWVVAQGFINKNLLPQVYLQEIANFIIKNAKTVTLGEGGSRSADPFTGGSSYNTCDNLSTTNSRGGFSGDPLTGASAYTTSLSGGTPNPYFPQIEFLQFASPPKISPMLKKLKEFNDISEPEHQLSQEELWKLPDFISQDCATQSDIDVLIKILKWPMDNLFPGLDLLRLSVLKESTQNILLAPTIVSTVLSVLLTNIETGSPPNNRMLALRTICNLFSTTSGLKEVMKYRESVVTRVNSVFPADNKNVEIAMSTVMLNLSVALKGDEEGQVQVLTSLVLLFLEGLSDPEAIFRALVALGTIISYSKDNVDYASTLDVKDKLTGLQRRTSVEKVSQGIQSIFKYL
ncbi:phospholipase A-2-activating protein [Lepeophtheirus salmonis]|uniref:phospholipase A-2-activating protein n=1 Tax=Lepeophtheirus salmonis TaxID=72036 RepID=UPI001AE424A9|nr:phospholipase A-2-activating protein-like [Lepeophtheirus salmonis]